MIGGDKPIERHGSVLVSEMGVVIEASSCLRIRLEIDSIIRDQALS